MTTCRDESKREVLYVLLQCLEHVKNHCSLLTQPSVLDGSQQQLQPAAGDVREPPVSGPNLRMLSPAFRWRACSACVADPTAGGGGEASDGSSSMIDSMLKHRRRIPREGGFCAPWPLPFLFQATRAEKACSSV